VVAVAEVVVTGLAVISACGRGTESLLTGTATGRAVFAPVTRFDTARYRTRAAAQLAGDLDLLNELIGVVSQACVQAELTAAHRRSSRLLLAIGNCPDAARRTVEHRPVRGVTATAAELATRCALASAPRVYTSACVAASTAVADAAAAIDLGRADRLVVAAGYLVDQYRFALFDAGRALAKDGVVRPFSLGRTGLLLGDGLVAMVIESVDEARRRGVPVLARISGWCRSGDAHHISQPDPTGAGLARAINGALAKAGLQPADVGYVNAHGTGTPRSDAAESTALYQALGDVAVDVPVSSSKSVHGHTLEASGLLELAITITAIRTGRLPVNAGFVAPDEHCMLNLVRTPQQRAVSHALSVNSAFGGANTALVVSVA
jgi:3-oxoacyl-(acyl-carrier-protein) synthase